MDSFTTLLSPRTLVVYPFSRVLSFPDVSAISTTVTTNNVMSPQFLNGQYSEIIDDMNIALHSPDIEVIKISIYTDASGTNFAVDSSGNSVDKKTVATTIYTYAHTDASNNQIDGYLTTYFQDGTHFGNNDTNDSAYWYTIEGMNNPPKQYT